MSTNQQQIQSYAYAPSATPENKASSPIYVLLAGIGAIEATGIDTIIRPISHRIVVEAQEFRIRALAKHVHRHGTHLVILDDDSIPYPNHIIPFLIARRKKLKVVILCTAPLAPSKAQAYFLAGAKAVICRSITEADVRTIVRRVLQGQEYYPPEVLREKSGSQGDNRNSMDRCMKGTEMFSPRENKIIDALLGGKRNKEIAELLGTSEQVIKNIFRRLYRKCDVRNRTELASLILRSS